jgi:hypothetical protein
MLAAYIGSQRRRRQNAARVWMDETEPYIRGHGRSSNVRCLPEAAAMLSLPNYSGPVMTGATPDPLQRNRDAVTPVRIGVRPRLGRASMGSDAMVPKICSPTTATELRRRRPARPEADRCMHRLRSAIERTEQAAPASPPDDAAWRAGSGDTRRGARRAAWATR